MCHYYKWPNVYCHISIPLLHLRGEKKMTRMTLSTTSTAQLTDILSVFYNCWRLDKKIVDFEAEVSVKFATSQLQTIVAKLKTSLEASITLSTAG